MWGFLSAGASVVIVHDNGGGESQPGLPCNLRQVVLKGPVAGMGHQADGSDPSVPPAPQEPFARPLDLLYDECDFYKYEGCFYKVKTKILPSAFKKMFTSEYPYIFMCEPDPFLPQESLSSAKLPPIQSKRIPSGAGGLLDTVARSRRY